ncbi:MAG: ornithine carbamoyltransferase [Thermoplasmata archaeon]|jgi:ornithine carbamoyltransferase|nr:ornithine carbamoyltransferase [Thermoplasmatales archaeon]
MKRDLVSITDVKDDLLDIINLGIEIKKNPKKYMHVLEGKSLAMIFEKPSTRTRTSFEVAMTQLGGHALYMSPRDMQLGRGETIEDTAKVLSRYVDAIVYRAFDHRMVVALAKNSTVPVINALDDVEHPAQIIADLMTILEKKGRLKGLKISFIGDGNNVANSLMLGSAIVGADFYIASPRGYEIKEEYVKIARSIAGNRSRIVLTNDPVEAAKDADVIYTDVWVSMGEEEEREKRERDFKDYQVNLSLVKHAKKDYIFMHCLPAHRGLEVTGDVIDGPNSVVFDEAENRLHAQKALLVKFIS